MATSLLLAIALLAPSAGAYMDEGSTAPWIRTELEDYAPGDLVVVNGGNWTPGHVVHLAVDDTTNHTWQAETDVTVSETGDIRWELRLPDLYVSDYEIAATDTTNGTDTAGTTFTDALTSQGATVNGGTAITVGPGDPVPGALTERVTSSAPSTWQSTRWTIGSSTGCADTTNVSATTTATNHFDMTAPTAAGTYSLVVTPYSAANCGGTAGAATTLTDAVTVDSGVLFSEYFGSAVSTDTPFWKDENQVQPADCSVSGPISQNYYEALSRGCTISTTNDNSRPIDTSGRRNIHVKFTWGKNSNIASASGMNLDLFWKAEASGSFPATPLCQTGQSSCTHTVTNIGTGLAEATTNAVDVTLPSSAAGTKIDLRFKGLSLCSGSSSGSCDVVRVDNVRVTGEPKLAQTIDFGPIAGKAYGDAAFDPGATASSGLPVTYSIASGPCSVTAQNEVAIEGAGSCKINADQAGDATYEAAARAQQTVTIAKASQAITITTGAPASKGYGGSFTVAATASSGLPVSYGSSGACSNTGAQFTMTSGSGTCTVTYTQAGDDDYDAAPQRTENVVAAKAAATLAFVEDDLAQTYDGSAKTVGVTTTPASLTGITVTYSKDGASVTEPTDAGSYTVRASLDNASYAADAITDTLTIGKAGQAITITTDAPASKVFGGSFTVAAKSDSGLPVSYGSSGACSNSGATFTMTSGTGTCTVKYDQPGNGNYEAASQRTQTVTATKAAASLAFVQADLTQTYSGSAKTVGVTTTPSGVAGVGVAFSQGGNAVTDPTDAGSYAVRATLTSDDYTAAAITDTLTIKKADQAIAITTGAPASKAYAGSFSVAASSDSGLTVSYSSSGACSNAGDTFTMTSGTGTCMVKYDQPGNGNYNAAPQRTESVAATKASLTVTADDKAMTYADPVPALTYKITGFVNGETLTTSDVSGSPALATTATSASGAGNYPITVGAGTLGSSNYAFATVNGKVVVSKRKAVVVYTGSNYMAIASAGTANVPVSAKVSRDGGGSTGNLALAKVQFAVKKFSGALQTTVYSQSDGTGVTAPVTAPVPTSDDPYTVEVQIDPANPYWTSGVDVGSLQVIVGSGTGRVAGGGWVADAANDINGKSNFGFTVQNAKTGIKGNSLFIYRLRSGSDEIQYIVKSNSWQGGGLTFNVNGDRTRATFTGKATVQRYVNGVFDSTFNSGGYSFTVDGLDGDLLVPKAPDGYAITVRNSANQVVKQLGSRSAPLQLGGGNVLVQST